MSGVFLRKKFNDIDLSDSFFDSLKNDYIEFPTWFQKKSDSGDYAFVFFDEYGIGAFVYIKKEYSESIILTNNTILPPINRIKIGTFKFDKRLSGRHTGERVLTLILQYWQKLNDFDEIYFTIFDKYHALINLITRFGFIRVGTQNTNGRNEGVYILTKRSGQKNLDECLTNGVENVCDIIID